MRGAVAVAVLAGCNGFYGIHDTRQQDGAPVADAGHLLIPSDGTTACPPPPSFDSWTFTAHTVTGVTRVDSPSFLAADHVLFASNRVIYEQVASQTATPVTDVDPMDGSELSYPAAAPGANVFWFVQQSLANPGLRVAVFDGQHWQVARADLPVVAGYVMPGAVGMYAGTARMVVATQSPIGATELASHDGVSWTVVADLAGYVAAPSMSANGCWLLSVEGGVANLRVRGGDGSFGPAQTLAAASSLGGVSAIALDPDASRMWVVRSKILYEGVP